MNDHGFMSGWDTGIPVHAAAFVDQRRKDEAYGYQGSYPKVDFTPTNAESARQGAVWAALSMAAVVALAIALLQLSSEKACTVHEAGTVTAEVAR